MQVTYAVIVRTPARPGCDERYARLVDATGCDEWSDATAAETLRDAYRPLPRGGARVVTLIDGRPMGGPPGVDLQALPRHRVL